jgi:aspartate/methionine/tyrosine aminotransferase
MELSMSSATSKAMPKHALPAHIEFSRQLAPYVTDNISDSTGQSLTLAQLCQLSNTDITQTQLQYASVQGSAALREAIVTFHQGLNSHQQQLSKDDAITFSGAQEALSAIYQSVLSPGDEVVVVTPSYPSLVSMAKSLGAKVKEIKLTQNNAWKVAIEDFERAVSSKTRLIVLNSPHNPTGSVIDSALAENILQLAKKYQCYLLSDDVSQASNYSGIALAHRYLDYQNSIVVAVMSKSFGLAGIRIGWALTPNKAIMDNLRAIKTRNSICCSAIDEALALIALENSQQILVTNNKIIADNITLFEEYAAQHSDLISWHPPKAGILALVEIKQVKSMTHWSTALAKNTGVLALPCELFGLSGNYFRLGLGQKDFANILTKFADYI